MIVKLKTYQILVPINGHIIYEVDAETEAEALQLLDSGELEGEYDYTTKPAIIDLISSNDEDDLHE